MSQQVFSETANKSQCLQGIEQPKAKTEGEEDGGEAAGDDDECGAEFQPIVQLSEVETVSGEEAETAQCDL